MTLAMLGVGEGAAAAPDGRARRCCGRHRAGRAGAKEGLALINGTQVSTALALHGLFPAETCSTRRWCRARSRSTPRAAATRRSTRACMKCAASRARSRRRGDLRSWWPAARSAQSHLDGDRVQDPYSLRCQPQVMGACLRTVRDAARAPADEANAVTDNPLVFADTGEVLSGGNFHAEPVAFAADTLALAIAEIGASPSAASRC